MFWKDHFFAAETPSAEPCSGRGISIAILDTGISPVADFIEPTNRIAAFLDLVGGKTEPYDDNGHGTQLTGTKAKAPSPPKRRRGFSMLYTLHFYP